MIPVIEDPGVWELVLYLNSMLLGTLLIVKVPLYPLLAAPTVLAESWIFLTITVSPTSKVWGRSVLMEATPTVES